ncbi:hypothetical protein PG994_013990 [Apiospora phragmitis]|uniref:Uncharacterized protein n=1 Tax=Apiospora phragmitis TaxID=2905665 RepID=A0ABR1T5E8_9PEZI
MRPGLIRHRPFSSSSALLQRQQQQQQQIRATTRVIEKQHQSHHHARHGATPKPTILRAHIYGTLFLSIALLVPDESLSWDERSELGIKTVQDVTSPASYAEKKAEFMKTGAALLSMFSGGGSEVVQVHEPLAATAESQLDGGQLENWVMTAPDPEVAGGTLVVCQSVFAADDEPDFYVSTHGSMNNDAAEALIPAFEAFAATLRPRGPVRGAMMLIQASGDWKCIYWDGKRWFNLIFLEWQTAESMGFVEE